MHNSIDIKEVRKQQKKKYEAPASENLSNKLNIHKYLNKDFRLGSIIPDSSKEEIYHDLASLLESGIDIRSALQLISDNQTKKKRQLILRNILSEIVNGSTFSNALNKSGIFTTYEYFSIQIGEETGKMIQVLNELAKYYKKKIRQRRQIIGAMTYPVIVLIIAFGAVSFMLTFVVPMFSDVFKRFGGKLPLATRMVVEASALTKNYSSLFFISVFLVVMVSWNRRRNVGFRYISSKVVSKIPMIGKLITKVYLARFAGTMALLIASKIPILKAIKMCEKMVGYYPIEKSLHDIEIMIMEGVQLHVALAKYSIYPPKMIAMLKVGEDINQLDLFFLKISDQYTEEIEHQTNVISKFIEPVIIVVLGAIVGVILIAMYLPLFKLGQSF